MASANSRRKEDFEAGRRKLEQFRKKREAERAKKASQSSTTTTQPVDHSQQIVSDSDGAAASFSDGPLRQSPQVSSTETDVHNLSFSNITTNDESKERSRQDVGQETVGAVDFSNNLELIGSSKNLTVNSRPEVVPYNSSNLEKQLSENFGVASTLREIDSVPIGTSSFSGSTLLSTSMQMDGFSHGSGLLSSNKESPQPATRMAGSSHELAKNQQGSGELGGGSILQKPAFSSSYLFSSPDTSSRPSESSDFSVNITNSSPFNSAKTEATVKRSRPSFLDSLNISRAPDTQYQPEIEADLLSSRGSQLTGSDGFGPSSLQYISGKRDSNGSSLTSGASDPPNPFEKFRSSLYPTANGVMPGFTDFSIPKQNDDFTALEQHIEDLTQEKFSLQRDLDASRALAESLASENSSLTDTYNQQRGLVNQLKDDMERLHQQIQDQIGELESVRIEYANAQLECNAADERSKILASEVISLEDKALRLRSNELKLGRELENAQAEMLSYKKKLQSLEKDRQDLQSTIKALQEEKKVLQTMVQKASSGGKSTDLSKSSTNRKNASTSTEGLATSDTMLERSNQETDSINLLESDSSNTAIIPETGQLSLEGFSLSVPADQMRVIHNINTLIAELAIEKEELVQALSSELSRRAQVQELNKELSRKLEAQTQRLELLTAQKMAIDNVSPEKEQPDSHVAPERPPIADEGDEVVERVLGWIMKMFPGGPSKRRTSKLL